MRRINGVTSGFGLDVAVNKEILFVEQVPVTRRKEGNLSGRISIYVERGNPVGRKPSGNRYSAISVKHEESRGKD
ncbi:MAG: hypothetical protein AAF320_00355 [Myxococcota bacterium]